MNIRERKRSLRELMLQARQNMDPEDIAREDAALVAHATAHLRSLTPSQTTVAAYAPMPGEPGGSMLLDALHAEASDLFLPISGVDGRLEWATYQGRLSMQPGRLGIHEPTGPRLSGGTLADCDLVFVPALAVNPEGYRLGKGGGYYDRALAPLAASEDRPRTAVLLYNGEICDDVPVEPHDVAVDLVITPNGIRHLS
ncbi:5-formyltetrahydrofolate cyclo-ligase [Corynebacterium halotolerans]|nr:5-formyltetrahydrofolate cyclo-ligase [Corynebacterium halotolerans]